MSKSDLEKEYESVCNIHRIEIDQEMLRRIRQVTPDFVAEQIISVSVSVSAKPSLAQDIAESKGDAEDE